VSEPVLAVSGLRKHFALTAGLFAAVGTVRAVEDVSFEIRPGETLGLVGESGSGKTTVGRCVTRLIDPTAGRITLNGADITRLSRSRLREMRRHMHVVFQDPYSSLDPRMSIGDIVAGPLRHHGIASGGDLRRRVDAMLEAVGMRAGIRDRFPHQLSGGQRQRVAIARALILEPNLLVADEPLSALDASVQASIINLLLDLQARMGFACLYITHDLSAAKVLCDRIAVMYLGRIVEVAANEQLFAAPRHPYTQALLSAVLTPDPSAQHRRRRVVLEGDIPSALEPPSGCVFHTRCPVAVARCAVDEPALVDHLGDGHVAACHLIGPRGEAPDILAGS
jgi:oligopeptide transport system ATP-binding protein